MLVSHLFYRIVSSAAYQSKNKEESTHQVCVRTESRVIICRVFAAQQGLVECSMRQRNVSELKITIEAPLSLSPVPLTGDQGGSRMLAKKDIGNSALRGHAAVRFLEFDLKSRTYQWLSAARNDWLSVTKPMLVEIL